MKHVLEGVKDVFGIGKYALRDIDTGESFSTDDPHEAAKFARYHGCVSDETGNTFSAMRALVTTIMVNALGRAA